MDKQKKPVYRNLWFERLMATIALFNLGLVFFDMSYVPWRDFYLRRVPQITKIYDPIKGIEPYRDTANYLKTVETLKEEVSQTGLRSSAAETLLKDLSLQSVEIIQSNPFAAAGKAGTLEKIKNRMRDRIYPKSYRGKRSATEAFKIFWSQQHLGTNTWQQEIKFFDTQIQPLIATNYYRSVGENGEFTDNFWIVDLPFITLFAVELLSRAFLIKRRHPGFSWLNAILWRWYDLFLLLPFFQWLRIIPVILRLDKAHLVNLDSIRKQFQQAIVSNFAEEITELVVVRVINQIQGSIQRGELTRWLLQKDSLRPYVDINNVNEMEAIAGILVQAIVYEVLPKIQPEIAAILRHNIDSALSQTPVYRNLENLPGVKQMQTQLSDQLATQITTNLYNAIVKATKDPVAAKLSSKLVQRFTEAFGAEIQKKHVIAELQTLLSDLLEEVKINYVQRLSNEDVEQILEQTRQLRTKGAVSSVIKKTSHSLPPR
ncbi:MAG: hypothetical protein KME60_18060 [Cyanomargarita calcarea GSE-NOS-MK-12-04C]|jgi:hypothetical protein|uniref:Uncharacterized protein n=1 Tax=Cyanomargarita calcarea GSE-NOS-MK-12-04C TaxID=2839659 RepID=A0A951UT16_9CYAN|nr:hypothetical protein [Cyanomargarita calcarea GSE-NOS-MK-12-04C]